MGRKCFVEGCNSGQPSCKEKVSLFSAPSDPKLLEAWARAIPPRNRAIGSKDAVCSKHFTDDMVLKKRYFAELGGKILLDVPKRVALAQGAVPSIFPSFPARPFPASKKRKQPATRRPPPLPKARKKYKTAEATIVLEEEPEVLSVQEDTACTETSEIWILPFREADAVGTDDQTNQTAAEETSSVLVEPEVRPVQEERSDVSCDTACDDTSETSKQTFREADVIRTNDQTAAKEATSMLVEPEVRRVQEEKSEVLCDTVCSDTSETSKETFREADVTRTDDQTAAKKTTSMLVEPEVRPVQEEKIEVSCDTACGDTSETSKETFREADVVCTDDQTAAKKTTSMLVEPEVRPVQEEKIEVSCDTACGDTSETSKETFREADVVHTDDQTAAKKTTSMLAEPEVRPVQEEKSEVSCDAACSDTSETSRQIFGEADAAGADDHTAASTVAESQESIESNGPSQACLDPSNACLPSTAWNHHTLCQQGLHSFCFTQAGLSSTGKPLSLKVLHVQQVKEAEFTLKTFALDHKIEIASVPSGCQLRYPDEWSIVTVALKDLDDLGLCPGGPQREKYADVYLERGYVDPAGVWRHNQCPIVQVGAWRCNFCARLANTLRIHRSRKEDCRELQRFRVPASCPSRPKVEALRKQWISCQRSNVRLRKAKERLTGELSSCRKKLEELSGNWLQKTLQEANLTEAQRRLVEECASAGTHKSKTGKKYDNNWLLLSLLLNIRTSTECEKKE